MPPEQVKKTLMMPFNRREIEQKRERDRILGRELILKSYPEAQLRPHQGVHDTHRFITAVFPKYTAQQQSLESTKVLVYAAVSNLSSPHLL